MPSRRLAFASSVALLACGQVREGTGTDASRPGDDAAVHDAGTDATDAPPVDAHTSDARAHDSGLPDGSCRTSADCPIPPGEAPLGCIGPVSPAAMCLCQMLPSCTTDSQCDAGNVCGVGPNVSPCNGDGTFCTYPCQTSSDCYPWQGCTSGHCEVLSCDECPTYLSCSSGACAAKSCTSDTDCPGGYCVDSACFATLGVCTPECG